MYTISRVSVDKLSGRLTGALIVTFVLLLTVLTASAAAAAPYEPNDDRLTAFGPLVGGTAYSGAHETNNDQDYFYFYTTGVVQLSIKLTNTGSSDCVVIAHLERPDDGAQIGSRMAAYDKEFDTFTYTSPGARKYILHIEYAWGENGNHNWPHHGNLNWPHLSIFSAKPCDVQSGPARGRREVVIQSGTVRKNQERSRARRPVNQGTCGAPRRPSPSSPPGT